MTKTSPVVVAAERFLIYVTATGIALILFALAISEPAQAIVLFHG